MIIAPSRAPAMRQVRGVSFPGPEGRLEALVNEASASARYAALICHPHPLGGGTMHNKVVYHAMKALNAPEWGLGWPVLRFNFRGTGFSEGVHDGEDEAEDVRAALGWLENEYNLPLVVVGFSFGAAMALLACCRHVNGMGVRAIAALGLPIASGSRHYSYSFLQNCMVPKLFLSGDQDEYAPKSELIRAVADAAEPKDMALVPGADHFFKGHLRALQSTLSGWLKEQFA